MPPSPHLSKNTTSRRSRLLLELVIRDLWHDRKVTFCILASLVAVIAPLLLLFGLKNGVVSQLQQQLLNDPVNLEIRLLSNSNLDQAWFQRLKAQPATGFAIPLTRSLNAQADLLRDNKHFVTSAEIIPTGPGDPLFGTQTPPQGIDEIALSASAARKLNVQPGDRIRLIVARKLQGQSERGQYQARIQSILPAGTFPRDAALVPLTLLVDMEDFRDGYRVEKFGFSTGATRTPRLQFARARIYARDLDSVAVLDNWLHSQNLETATRIQEIQTVQSIRFVLGVIFGVIAWTALLGCTTSLAGALIANVDRKRKDIALLRLLGFHSSAIALHSVLQVLIISLLAFATGLLLYGAGSLLFNRILGSHLPDGGFICTLSPLHLLLALAGTLTLSTLVAVTGSLRAARIQPAESLRDL